MGKKIRVQRRGRGAPTFKASTHKRVAPTHYVSLTKTNNEAVKAVIEDLVHESGRGSPLAKIRFKNTVFFNVAAEGISKGQEIQLGTAAPIGIGNILPVGKIPSGTMVCNIELSPGDGGKLVKSSGTYATIVAHTPEGTLVKLPSGKSTYFKNSCRATIGIVAGAGRTDKPFLKAGKKLAWLRSKGRLYPITSGIAMNAVDHPHGGGRHKSTSLKPTTVSRTAPPGQKVGMIASRQTGRRKRRK
ncbi:MAG: 50S ribosomal protein L2 [Candidatus Bathyarchaeota archaeon]|nr:MAG: 50S ribosomal protein L2 [Candidatus Bathyarchaeota archaeon]